MGIKAVRNTANPRLAGLELRHFRYFIAVAEELHFGNAARRLHMAQPPLSQQIKGLEEELGVRLLTRNTHRVAMTEAGRIFLKEARRVLADVERSVRLVRQVADGTAGRLCIGFVSMVDGGVIARVKAVLSAEYPELDLAFLPLTPSEQVAFLREGKIQAGVISAPLDEDDLTVDRIFRAPLVIALPEHHWLADRTTVRLKDLENEPFISYVPQFNPWIHRLFQDCCRRDGFVPRVIQEATSPQSITGFVASGTGVGIMPAWVKTERRGVIYRALEPDDFPVYVAVAQLKGQDSLLVRHLRKLLESELKETATQVA